mmetsp:Transcript_157997/g.383678  ORF Transcript_157997/g.383678 Transcript_157997/m.383678 type:complete len:108 (+) Transcript_157997:1158-1481(+)
MLTSLLEGEGGSLRNVVLLSEGVGDSGSENTPLLARRLPNRKLGTSSCLPWRELTVNADLAAPFSVSIVKDPKHIMPRRTPTDAGFASLANCLALNAKGVTSAVVHG